MLATVGVNSVNALYADVPDRLKFNRDYELTSEMSETEVRAFFDKITDPMLTPQLTCFAGAGCYDHYSPSVVQNLVERSEFLTSYTPYQAEIS